MPLLRTGLAYPAGIKAGFDPSHIAVQGQVTGRIFSAVAHNRNMVSLLRGLPGALGATAITFGMDGIAGPTAVFTDNSTTCTTGFSGHTTGTDAVCTMAYIGVFPSAPTATAVLNSSNASNRMAMGIVGGFYNVYVGTAFTDVSSGIPVLTGAPFFLCCSLRTGASNFVLVNLATGKVTTATSATAFTNNTTDGIFQVGANSQVNSTNLNLSAVMYSPKSMNMSQLLKWASDPWSFWYPQQARSKLGSGVNAYTLTAAAGSYALTGTAAPLLHKYVVSASAGAYTLTGTAATLRRNLPLVAGAGSYAFTGTAASLRKTWLLGAGAGAYTLTGSAVTLRRDLPLIAGSGSYTLTGTAATLRRNLPLVASAGAYTLTGSAVTLTYLSGKTVVAGAGSYTFTGTAASLLHKYLVSAGAGSYALSGVAATLRHGYVVTVGAGTYTLTGSAATLRRAWLLSAGAGSYVLSGSAATLRHGGVVGTSSSGVRRLQSAHGADDKEAYYREVRRREALQFQQIRLAELHEQQRQLEAKQALDDAQRQAAQVRRPKGKGPAPDGRVAALVRELAEVTGAVAQTQAEIARLDAIEAYEALLAEQAYDDETILILAASI